MTPFSPTYPSSRDFAPSLPGWTAHDARAEDAPRWPVAVLGVPFEPLTRSEAVARISAMVASRRSHQVVTANVDFLVQARDDRELRRIFLEAELVLCDGAPVRWASRLLGNALPERVAGADLVPDLIAAAERNGHRIFLLGAAPGVAAQAAERIARQWPRAHIVGHHSPPIQPMLEMNHDEIIQQVRAARPDILLVSFGCPKQEKWIAMHLQALEVPVVIGVGATIDFLAGRVCRAPRWMRECGLEWFFRLAREPFRLHRRYRANVRHFFPALAAQWHHVRRRGFRHGAVRGPSLRSQGAVLEIDVGTELTRTTVERHSRFWRTKRPLDISCIADLSAVEVCDATGLALLIDWRRRVHAFGGRLVLLRPTKAVRAVLRDADVHDHFLIAGNLVEAQQWLAGARDEPPVSCDVEAGFVRWHGEVVAANARAVWRLTLQYLFAFGVRRPAVVIDLSDVRFIDSTAAALMLRLKEAANTQFGYEAIFIGAQPAVRNVLRCAGAAQLLPAR
jgi:N-acetylglucosaminyldiphosphoundecaprenol N-acetyl-beta-D-mannosaminyltransferase